MKKFLSCVGVTGLLLTAGCSAYDDSAGNYYHAGPNNPNQGRAIDAGVAADEGEGALPSDEEPRDVDREKPEPNPFVETAHDPFSTFAADVDTASYQYALRILREGGTPNPNDVRLEDFVNYFDYEYETPEANSEIPFAIDLAGTDHPLGRATKLVRVGIQAEAPPNDEQKPANLVFLVDISGSMSSGDKLALVKTVLTQTLTVLREQDTVSIVTYAGSTGVALPPTPVAEAEHIRRVIESFSAGGSTAGAAGIDLAYQQAKAAFIEGGINHVLICTDGDFNVGTSSTEALVELIEQKRDEGITLTALGFGIGHNDAMMELVSNAGNGIYGYIGDQDSAVGYVQDRMLSTLVHVAQDLKIQVEFNPEEVAGYRLLGYENRYIPDYLFRDDTVDAGEVGAGHRVTALYELVLTEGAFPEGESIPERQSGEPVEGERATFASGELMQVRVRWKDVDAIKEDPASETEQGLIASDVSATKDAGQDLRWAAAIAGFAERLMLSPYASDAELPTIREIVDAQAERDADRREFADVLTNYNP